MNWDRLGFGMNNILWTLKMWKVKFCGKSSLITTKLELQHDCVNQIFNTNALFFFPLTGATCCYYAFYKVFKYFASFKGYEDDISNCPMQRSEYCKKNKKFGEKIKD